MLELVDLHKRYGDVVALDGVSLRVPPSSLVGFPPAPSTPPWSAPRRSWWTRGCPTPGGPGWRRRPRARTTMADAGVPPAVADDLLRPAPLEVAALDPPDEEAERRGQIVFVGVFLLYGQLIGYGFWLAGGVVEEKASRVVKVVLAKVRPSHLLGGKIVGVGLVGLGQLLGLVAIGLATVVLSGSVDLPPGTALAAAEILAWFVLGYAFYSCAFAVAGALASRMEELQNTAGVLNLVVVASFLAALAGAQDPDGTVARVASFFPPSAPLTMPLRTAAGAAEGWEVALAVVITLAAVLALVPLAGRVNRGGALRTRRQVSLREAWRGAAS